MRIDKNNKDIFHDLKFCYLNVCGLKSRLLCPDFINIIQQNDICVFTETKLTELDQLDLPLDYKMFVKNRNIFSSPDPKGHVSYCHH